MSCEFQIVAYMCLEQQNIYHKLCLLDNILDPTLKMSLSFVIILIVTWKL